MAWCRIQSAGALCHRGRLLDAGAYLDRRNHEVTLLSYMLLLTRRVGAGGSPAWSRLLFSAYIGSALLFLHGSGILLPHAVGSHGVLSGVFFHRFRIGTAPVRSRKRKVRHLSVDTLAQVVLPIANAALGSWDITRWRECRD